MRPHPVDVGTMNYEDIPGRVFESLIYSTHGDFRVLTLPLIGEQRFDFIYSPIASRPGISAQLQTALYILAAEDNVSWMKVHEELWHNTRWQFATNTVGRQDLPGHSKMLYRFRDRCILASTQHGLPNPLAMTDRLLSLYTCMVTGQDLSLLRVDSTQVSDGLAHLSRENMVFKAP